MGMSDYNFLMEIRLSAEQFQFLNHLSRIAASQGANLYLVGGAVRELTSGQGSIHDLDFAVDGNLQHILRHLESRTPSKTPPHPALRHGVELEPLKVERLDFDLHRQHAEIRLAAGVRASIRLCQVAAAARAGREPEVKRASIFEDLRGRDFSVNAMAVSLHPNSRGLLLDPTNGAADIERRELRALHSRSFIEDPSRIFRLLRLGSRLEYKPEQRTQAWFELSVEQHAWENLDAAARGRELRAVLEEENPGKALKLFADQGLLAGLDGHLTAARIPFDRLEKVRNACRTLPGVDPFLVNFHELVQKLPGPLQAKLAKTILGDPKMAKAAAALTPDAKKLVRDLASSKAETPSFVYKLLEKVPQPLLLFVLVNYPQTKVQNRIKNFVQKYPQTKAGAPRTELLALGLEPGQKFESVLHQVFLMQLDGKIHSQAQLIATLRQLAGIPEPPPELPTPKAAAKEPSTKAKTRKPGVAKAKPPASRASAPRPAPQGKSAGSAKRVGRGR